MMNSAATVPAQVDFTPLGAYRFFRPADAQLASRMVGLDDLADPRSPRRRLERRRWNDRLDLAEAFVLARLQSGPELSRGVVSAYRELAFCHGNIRIEAISTRLGWSRKHLSQRFQDEIGLSPKSLARMMRFNRALDLANLIEQPNWAGLAAECGYADQAHLTREFGEFAGATPTGWQARAA